MPDSVRFASSEAVAMRLNQSPSRLTICPIHSQRKFALPRIRVR